MRTCGYFYSSQQSNPMILIELIPLLLSFSFCLTSNSEKYFRAHFQFFFSQFTSILKYGDLRNTGQYFNNPDLSPELEKDFYRRGEDVITKN